MNENDGMNGMVTDNMELMVNECGDSEWWRRHVCYVDSYFRVDCMFGTQPLVIRH